MSLTGPQVQELKYALLSAFDEASLAEMVRVRLQEKLAAIAGGSNLGEIVFNLIIWAEQTGRIDELVNGAAAQNPGNPELKAFAAQYDRNGGLQLVPSQGNGASTGDVTGRSRFMERDAEAGYGGAWPLAFQRVVSEADIRDLENRRILRQMVNRYWIDGVLSHSLQYGAVIKVNVSDLSNVVENRPWNIIPQTAADASSATAVAASLSEMFDRMGQRMLILGEPGSGKTTMLLQLARDLIKRADQVPTQHTPVVLNLASWSQRRDPIVKWLADELAIRYNIPKKLAQSWIGDDKLLLLLDGLDEVQPQYRNDCVTAINGYLQEHLVPLSVCSRAEEYRSLTTKLALNCAILLQPLNDEQIDSYLGQGAQLSAAVHATIRQDAELHRLARSPLMLSIMVSVYQGAPSVEIDASGPQRTRYQALLDAYIRQMFERREIPPAYTPVQTIRWLQWLAARLEQTGQSMFMLERIQPAWLAPVDGKSRLSSLTALAGLVYCLAVGLIGGLILGLLAELIPDSGIGVEEGLSLGLFVGLVIGIAWSVVDIVSGRFRTIEPPQPSVSFGASLKSSLYSALYWGLAPAFLFGLIDGVRGQLLSGPEGGIVFGISNRILVGALGALANLIIGSAIGSLLGASIQVEPIRRSLVHRQDRTAKLKFGSYYGLLFMGVSVLVFVLNAGLDVALGRAEPTESILFLGGYLVVGLVGGPVFGFLFQPSTVTAGPPAQKTVVPNQGIRVAAKRTLVAGLSIALLYGLVYGLMYGFVDGRRAGLLVAFFIGMTGYLLSSLVAGAGTVTKHLMVRLGLYLQGHAPWNYAQFLDFAAGLAFLLKIGGGYMFIHRLMMDHFAALSDEDIVQLGESRQAKQETP